MFGSLFKGILSAGIQGIGMLARGIKNRRARRRSRRSGSVPMMMPTATPTKQFYSLAEVQAMMNGRR